MTHPHTGILHRHPVLPVGRGGPRKLTAPKRKTRIHWPPTAATGGLVMSPHLPVPLEYQSESFVPVAPLWLLLGGGP